MTDSFDTDSLLDDLDLNFDSMISEEQVSPALSAEDNLGPGGFIASYHLGAQVGSGGVAKVWRARNIHPGYADQWFAVKVLHDDLALDQQAVEHFRHEAYLLSLLKHRNVVRTFEAGTHEGKLFIAMEYVDGCDLDHLLERCRGSSLILPIPLLLHFIAESLKALNYAHRLCDMNGRPLELVHQDVNPANLFLAFNGAVKLGDFGVASIAAGQIKKDRELAGKAGYFSPEQLHGQPVDLRTDLFAVGVMLFELLTSSQLFQGADVDAILKSNKKAKVVKPSKLNPQIPSVLDQVCLKALQRKPQDRFQDGQQFYQALDDFLDSKQVMPLAVAVLLRTAFLSEYLAEIEARSGLTRQMATQGEGQLIAICSADSRSRTAFSSLLESKGYRCCVFDNLASFFALTEPTQLLLMDLSYPHLKTDMSLPMLVQLPVAIMGYAPSFSMEFLALADAMQACDMVFAPFDPARTLVSVGESCRGTNTVQRKLSDIDEIVPQTVRIRVQVVGNDPGLESIVMGLEQAGHQVEQALSVEEALSQGNNKSYHVILFDALSAGGSPVVFCHRFRTLLGVEVTPVLLLRSPVGMSSALPPRCRLCNSNSNLEQIMEQMLEMHFDHSQGRTFIRYDTQFNVSMRFAGRSFQGQTLNVSRGGIMMSCPGQMPTLGSEVSLTLRLPLQAHALEAHGWIRRVELEDEGHARLGIELWSFAAREETQFITYLGQLESLA